MKTKRIFLILMIITSLWCLFPLKNATQAKSLSEVSANDLIALINGMRVNQGLPALEVNSILMATAQQTADTMAVNDLHWHIGGVSDRVSAAGYGGGAKVWATENFAIGPMTIDQIQAVWDDPDHMIPVVNANYLHIGAGVTEYNGRVWYIVHAAYTSGGTYNPPTAVPGATAATSTPAVSQIIIPVATVTPNAGGAVIHKVQSGQSLWSIAIAYNTKIDEIVRLNGLSGDTPTIWVGQELLIVAADPNYTPAPETPTPEITKTEATASPSPTAEIEAANTASPPPSKTPTLEPTATMLVQEVASALPPTPTPTLEKAGEKETVNLVLNNKTIGIILVSVLALGILMIFAGMLQKPKP